MKANIHLRCSQDGTNSKSAQYATVKRPLNMIWTALTGTFRVPPRHMLSLSFILLHLLAFCLNCI